MANPDRAVIIASWVVTVIGSFLIAAIVIGGFRALIWVSNSTPTRYEKFMSECTQDHKWYQCEAMWRGAKP